MSVLLSPRRELGEFKKRYKWMALFVVVIFGVLVGRLVMLQVAQQEMWAEIARENITKTFWLRATRGMLRDANGRVIASNRPSYDVYVIPRLLLVKDDDAPEDAGVRAYTVHRARVDRLAELMALTPEQKSELERRLLAFPATPQGRRRLTHQVAMFSDITRDQMAALETHRLELPMVDVIDSPVRSYAYGSLGAHAIGYLNEVSADDLSRLAGQDYRAGDNIGRTGIEQSLESVLRGRRGFRRVLVDSSGRARPDAHRYVRRPPTSREAEPGRDVVLTLDMQLMRSAHRAFGGHPSGAAVVVDIRSGRVRALYSKPSVDLNQMSMGMPAEQYRAHAENPFRPLIDKTIYETYFPGSTFKPITALAALGDRLVDPSLTVECEGRIEIGPQRMRCTKVHGYVDMHRAMVQSCNVYFWRIAEQVGLDRLNRYATAFGLGERTGIGINSEARGFLASRQWYEEHYGRFRMGYTLNTSIGQGNTRVTLVQLALAYAAMANGGTLYAPQLIERIETPDGRIIEELSPQVRRQIELPASALAYNHAALVDVVHTEDGTAFEAYERVGGNVRIAGKTGTAQVSPGILRPGVDARSVRYFSTSHAWFAGYAPAENPTLAVVVIVEHVGFGGRNAAPIAIQMIEDYFGQQRGAEGAPAQAPRTPARGTDRPRPGERNAPRRQGAR